MDKQAELMAIFARGGTFAAPAHLVEPKLDELRRIGYRPRLTKVRVGEFLIKAYVFRCDNNEELSLDAVMIANVLGVTFRDDQEFEECVDGRRIMPLLTRRPGLASILLEPSQDSENFRQALSVLEKLLQRFSRLTGLRVLFHIDCGAIQAPFPEETGSVQMGTGCIHIFPGARPPGEGGIRYAATAFGLLLAKDGRPQAVHEPTAGRGTVLGDDSGPLVQIIGSNIYLLCPMTSTIDPQTVLVMLDRLLALAWDGLTGAKRRPRPVKAARRSDFIQTLTKSVEGAVDQLRREEEEDVDVRIEEYQAELARMYRRKREIATMVAAYRESSRVSETVAGLPEQYRLIKAEPDAAKLAIVEGGLQVETRPIVIEHQGVRRDTGPFVIRVGKSGVVSVWSEEPRHPGGVPHPHIAKHGGPCFGNATEAVAKAGAEHRYCDVIRLVMRWLKYGYTPQLATVKIEEWPVVGDNLPPKAALEQDAQAAAAAAKQAKEVSGAGA